MDSLDCSIVIPAWNAELHIGTAIASALDQAPVKLEVIVVDDASTDGTVQRVRGLGDPRIRVLERPKNGGAAAARNLGFAVAEGRFIAVLDADDQMRPGRLGPMLAQAEAERLDIVADNMIVRMEGQDGLHIKEDLDGSLEMIGLEALFSEANLLREGVEYGYLKPAFRREFLKTHGLVYDETLRIGEDFQLLADSLAKGARFGRIRTAGYIYERRVGSTSYRLKPGHLSAIAAADAAFLGRYGEGLDGRVVRAVERRRRNALDGEAFVNAVEALKERRVAAAVTAIAARPAAIAHFLVPIRDRLRRLARPPA